MTLRLTPRLQTIADRVPTGARLVDVGTDHAYLPVWLILNHMVERAIAADLRPGPLERARQTARRYGVAEQLDFRLCDGLTGIRPEEVDAIAIAGMGGDTIQSILLSAPWARGKTLLLQPMTAQSELRRWLGEWGYAIEEEHIAREGQRLYSIWTVKAGQMPPMTPGELWAGAQSNDPLRGAYLDYISAKLRRALAGHRAAAQPNETEIEALQAVLDDLTRMKGEWTSWQ